MAWTPLEQHAIDVLQELLELKQRAAAFLPRFAARASDLEVRTVLSEHLAALADVDLDPLLAWYDVALAPNAGRVWLALYVDAERTLDRGHDPDLVDARLTQHLHDLEALFAARCHMLAGWSECFGAVTPAHHLRTIAADTESRLGELAAVPTPVTGDIATPWMPWT